MVKGNVTNKLYGGKGDNLSEYDVDIKQLKIGIAVEMEHTNSISVAKEIATDHLSEYPDYYTKLIKSGLVDEKEAIILYNKYHLHNKKNIAKESISNNINKIIQNLVLEEISNKDKIKKIDNIINRLQETQNKISSIEEDLLSIAKDLNENEIGSTRNKFGKRIESVVQYFNAAILKYGPFKGKSSPIMRVVNSLEKIKEGLGDE
jgi:hypothetical protein